MGQYLPILALLVLTVVFVIISLAASKLLAPQAPSPAKLAPYECGIIPGRETPDRFPVRFFLVAMIFIVFDIEIIFLFPWATVYRELAGYGLAVMAAFIVPFFLSFVWEISQGGLDWGPLKRGRRLDAAVSAERTGMTTVRRVGLDGREDAA